MRTCASLSLFTCLCVALTQAQPPSSIQEQNNQTRYSSREVWTGDRAQRLPASTSSVAPTSSDQRFPGTAGFFSRGKPSAEEARVDSEIQQATRNLKSSDSTKKLAAEDNLRVALEKLFDLRSGSRESKIEDLEVRLKKLRGQLEERKLKKDEIVELRVQTVVNEANGLTF